MERSATRRPGDLNLDWLDRHAARLDPHLRRHVADTLQGSPRWPAWLKRPVSALRSRRARFAVIVQLESTPGPEHASVQLSAFCAELTRWGCRGVRHHVILGAASAQVDLEALRRLAADPRVRRVWVDRPVRALLDVAAPSLRAPSVWQAGWTGSGVAIAIVDTGIHPHPDFTRPRNRIIAFHDAVAGRPDPYDDHGHGTHVAGIAAGNGFASSGRYRGIAPDASLVGVKVLDATGTGLTSSILAGLEWCLNQRQRLGLRVVNLSLGAPAQTSWQDDPLALAVGRLWQEGLVVCCAAGNSGPGPATIVSPAIHPSVITVGAADDRATPDAADDRVAPFSSRGPTADGAAKPELVMPGVDITSAYPPPRTRWPFCRPSQADGYQTLSGTSMATPMASGLAALILQREPAATPEAVKARMIAAARSLGEPPTAQGHGEPDAVRAVLGAAAVTPQPAPLTARAAAAPSAAAQ